MKARTKRLALLVVWLAFLMHLLLQLPMIAAVYTLFWAVRMKLQPGTPEVQVRGCYTFMQAAQSCGSNKGWMLYAGAVDASIMALRSFPNSKEVQHACTQGVSFMALYSLGNQEAAGEKGAVELVLDAQSRWPEDFNLQMGGASGCFMDFSRRNRIRFERHGGIKVLLDAIRNHFDRPEVVVQSWYGFSSGNQPPNAEAFVEAGGLEEGIRCMRAHAKSFRVREEVMQAFRSPLLDAKNRAVVAEAGYITDLVKTMHDAPLDYHQISPACANLVLLANYNRTHRLMAVKAGATQAALQAVTDFPRMKPTVAWSPEFDAQYTVYEDCIGLMNILMRVCEAHQYLVESNASNVVEEVLSTRQRRVDARGDMAQVGWGSDARLLHLTGQEILKWLRKPCVESEKDVIYENGGS